MFHPSEPSQSQLKWVLHPSLNPLFFATLGGLGALAVNFLICDSLAEVRARTRSNALIAGRREWKSGQRRILAAA